jgi:hypothetical protein
MHAHTAFFRGREPIIWQVKTCSRAVYPCKCRKPRYKWWESRMHEYCLSSTTPIFLAWEIIVAISCHKKCTSLPLPSIWIIPRSEEHRQGPTSYMHACLTSFAPSTIELCRYLAALTTWILVPLSMHAWGNLYSRPFQPVFSLDYVEFMDSSVMFY